VILNGSSRFAEDVKALGAEIAGLGADPGDRDGSGWRQTVWMPLSRIWRRTFSGNEAEVRT
jgi:hypothetical protein